MNAEFRRGEGCHVLHILRSVIPKNFSRIPHFAFRTPYTAFRTPYTASRSYPVMPYLIRYPVFSFPFSFPHSASRTPHYAISCPRPELSRRVSFRITLPAFLTTHPALLITLIPYFAFRTTHYAFFLTTHLNFFPGSMGIFWNLI